MNVSFKSYSNITLDMTSCIIIHHHLIDCVLCSEQWELYLTHCHNNKKGAICTTQNGDLYFIMKGLVGIKVLYQLKLVLNILEQLYVLSGNTVRFVFK